MANPIPSMSLLSVPQPRNVLSSGARTKQYEDLSIPRDRNKVRPSGALFRLARGGPAVKGFSLFLTLGRTLQNTTSLQKKNVTVVEQPVGQLTPRPLNRYAVSSCFK